MNDKKKWEGFTDSEKALIGEFLSIGLAMLIKIVNEDMPDTDKSLRQISNERYVKEKVKRFIKSVKSSN